MVSLKSYSYVFLEDDNLVNFANLHFPTSQQYSHKGLLVKTQPSPLHPES